MNGSSTHRGGGSERPGVDWPGREHGISDRQSEILALITQGKRNEEIAVLTHLSPNTVKTHIRTLYSKIGARRGSTRCCGGPTTGSGRTTAASTGRRRRRLSG